MQEQPAGFVRTLFQYATIELATGPLGSAMPKTAAEISVELAPLAAEHYSIVAVVPNAAPAIENIGISLYGGMIILSRPVSAEVVAPDQSGLVPAASRLLT